MRPVVVVPTAVNHVLIVNGTMSSTPLPATRTANPNPPTALGRLVDVIVDPRDAFHGISDRSPWALAFAVVITLRFVSLLVFYQPEVTIPKLIAGVLFQVGTVAPMLLAVTTVVWLAARAWRVRLTWQSAFSATTHVCVAHTLATIALASVAGVVLAESAEIDLRSPPFSNIAYFVTKERDLLGRVLAELDIRSAYGLALMWIGVRAAAPTDSRTGTARVIATCAIARLLLALAGPAPG
jgi:hypothetical protein